MQENHPSWCGSSSGIQLGGKLLLGGIQGLLMHWQCPAALTAVGICCKLVKAVCVQATLIYPRVPARHSTNHRSRERLAWFLLFSPNAQMHFVLSDHGRSTEPEAETPGQCKSCCKSVCGSRWLWVSGQQRPGMRKGKGNRKRTEGTMHNAMFSGKSMLLLLQSCSFAAGDRGHTPSSEPHCQTACWSSRASVLVWMTVHCLLLGCTPQHHFRAKAVTLRTV